MKQVKRWIALAVAAAALVALTVPAMASASKVESSKNVLAPVGTVLTLTSSNTEISNTKFGTWKCSNWAFNDKLTENTGSTVAAANYGFGTTKECRLGAKEFTITEPKIFDVKSTSSGKGTLSMSFYWTVAAIGTCFEEGKSIPFTYTPGSNLIQMSGGLVATPSACGTGTGAEVHGSYNLVIGSTPVILN